MEVVVCHYSIFFKDTVFLKENSDLQYRYDALMKLKDEYPKCEELYQELYIVKKSNYKLIVFIRNKKIVFCVVKQKKQW